jgi:hypothetical protein
MAFVKIVDGSEIYNFRIQSFVHLYSKKMELVTFKLEMSQAAPHTGRLGVSTRATPEVSRRPSRTFPGRMHPEASLFLPMPHVACRPRRAHAPSGLSVRLRSHTPADAAAVLWPHLRRHRVVTGENARPI